MRGIPRRDFSEGTQRGHWALRVPLSLLTHRWPTCAEVEDALSTGSERKNIRQLRRNTARALGIACATFAVATSVAYSRILSCRMFLRSLPVARPAARKMLHVAEIVYAGTYG